jgi:hypothetical protein
MAVWYCLWSFVIFFPIWNVSTKKNLATLALFGGGGEQSLKQVGAKFLSASSSNRCTYLIRKWQFARVTRLGEFSIVELFNGQFYAN